MIGELAKDGELEIVRHGGQKRGDRRVLRLTPYAHIHSPKKGDKVLAPLTDIKEDNAVAIKEDKSDTLRGTRYVG
jgi:exosome complex RNA-binding protein Csl4